MNESAGILTLLERLEALGRELNTPLFLAGGGVRDLLLGGEALMRDIDLAVEGPAAALAAAAQREFGGALTEFPDFMTAKLSRPAACPEVREIDFASARRESYARPGALPRVEPAPIEEDLKRRDFSLNAMALPLGGLNQWLRGGAETAALRPMLLDYHGGAADLERRLIRVLHPGSFLDDPTRIFRACRYAVRIGGELEAHTAEWLRAAAAGGALETVSMQRRLTELKKIAGEGKPGEIIALLAGHGVFDKFILFDPARGEAVLAALGRLDDLRLALPEGMYYKLMLRIFAAFSGKEPAAGMLRRIGLGKKEVRLITADVERSRNAAPGRDWGDEALLLAAVIGNDIKA